MVIVILGCLFGFCVTVWIVHQEIIKPLFTYSVGTCFTSRSKKERWEEPSFVYKIVEVGKKKYRAEVWDREAGKWTDKWHDGGLITMSKIAVNSFCKTCTDPSIGHEGVK